VLLMDPNLASILAIAPSISREQAKKYRRKNYNAHALSLCLTR